MAAILTRVLADLRRRRIPAIVVCLVVLLASGTATLALSLLGGSSSPYDTAFARQRGGHILQEFNSAGVTAAALRRTARLSTVAAASEPWMVQDVPFELPSTTRGAAPPKFYLHVVGRGSPGGPVDDLHLVAGRWARGPGEVVLTRSFAQSMSLGPGAPLRSLGSAHGVTLRVVGEVIDVDEMDAANQNPQHAWVLPGALHTLLAPHAAPQWEMAYRFHRAASDADLRRGLAQIGHALPVGSLGFTRTYLDVRTQFGITNSLILTFLAAFSVFALGAAALVVANIVTGTVLAQFREIGIMKAVGYTPRQVVVVLVAGMVLPACVGCLLGVPLGMLLSVPLLDSSAVAMGLSSPSAFSLPAVVLAAGSVLLVVAFSAAFPAWRAGSYSAIQAITVGAAPSRRRGGALMRRLAGLPLPRPVGLGIAMATARPLRAAFTIAAVLVGAATMTFAVGLRATVQRGLNDPAVNGGEYSVVVDRFGSMTDAAARRAIERQPGTGAVVGRDEMTIAVAGLARPVQTVFTWGNARALGLAAEGGRWYTRPGDVVAAPAFLHETHLRVGSSFTATVNNHRLHLHLVGTVFDTSEFGRILHTDASTALPAIPGYAPSEYLVRLQPGISAVQYAQRLSRAAPNGLTVSVRDNPAVAVINTIDAVIAVLAIILGAIALLSVFNTVLLTTRERIRDTAILRSVGMTPAQLLGMVATSATVLGVVGSLLGIPAGMILHTIILQVMAAMIGNDNAPVGYSVFGPEPLLLVLLAGTTIAVIGGLLPALWAGRQRPAAILRAE